MKHITITERCRTGQHGQYYQILTPIYTLKEEYIRMDTSGFMLALAGSGIKMANSNGC